MTLQQLKILTLIATYGQLTAVADHLRLRQPTVTFHMKKLEEHAGMPLFVFKHKRVLLTEAGQALLQHAIQIVNRVEEAEQILEDYRTYRRGKIVIGASNTPATYILPQWLGEMKRTFPQVQVDLQIGNAPMVVSMLMRFEIDFGLIGEQQGHIHNADLHVFPLFHDELGLVVHPDHPLALADPLPWDFLQRQQWILREKDSASRRMFEQWAIQNGIEWGERNIELGSTEAIKRAVNARLGVAMLSHLAVREEIEEGKLVFRTIASPFLDRKIFFVYHRNRYMTPLIENIIAFFRSRSEISGHNQTGLLSG